MLPSDFIALHPQLFHMAEADTWPSIRRLGLLSACALVDLFQVPADRRVSLIRGRRALAETLSHPDLGTVLLRDQGPMSEAKLLSCLTDLEPPDWYELLNRRIFLWPSAERLAELLGASSYCNRVHTVLTIDTAKLVDGYRNKIELSAINSGATLYNPPPRGSKTFRSLTAFHFEELARKRGSRKAAIAEVTVLGGITDIAKLVERVDHVHPGGSVERLPIE